MRQLLLLLLVLCTFYFIPLAAQNKISIAIIGEASSCSQDYANSIAATAETVIARNQRYYAIKPEVYKHILSQLDRQKDPNYLYSNTFAEQFKAVGAQYILYTNVIGCGADDSKDGDGKFLGYRGWVEISASVVDLGSTTSKASAKFKPTGSLSNDRSSAQASAASSTSIQNDIEDILKNAFPIELNIIKLTGVKKDKVEEMLVSGGSELGLQKGDFFDVIILDQVNGEPFEENIGRIQVKELNGGKISTAKATKGGKEILAAFNDKKRVVLRSTDRRPIIDLENILKN